MKPAWLLFLIFLLPREPAAASSDRSWDIEFRAGPAVATRNFGDDPLRTGFGLSGTAALEIADHIAVYGGWGWTHFSAANSFAGADIDIEENGYTFGLEYVHPIGSTALSWVVTAGGVLDHIEVQDAAGKTLDNSGHGFGWEAGVGLQWDLSSAAHIAPEVRYRSLERDLLIGGATHRVDLTYISFTLGLSRFF